MYASSRIYMFKQWQCESIHLDVWTMIWLKTTNRKFKVLSSKLQIYRPLSFMNFSWTAWSRSLTWLIASFLIVNICQLCILAVVFIAEQVLKDDYRRTKPSMIWNWCSWMPTKQMCALLWTPQVSSLLISLYTVPKYEWLSR